MKLLANLWAWLALVLAMLTAITTLTILQLEVPEVISRGFEWVLAAGVGGGLATIAQARKDG